MARRLKVDLFKKDSLSNLVSEIEKYKKTVEYKTNLLASILAQSGVDIAKINVVQMNAVFTTDLLNSIHVENASGNIFYIVADSEHAIFVEIGTGIIGAQHPYHGALPVEYAQGKYIRDFNGKYGWFYCDRFGKWHFTEGMPSRPFMYNTTLELYKMVTKTAKKVFDYVD